MGVGKGLRSSPTLAVPPAPLQALPVAHLPGDRVTCGYPNTGCPELHCPITQAGDHLRPTEAPPTSLSYPPAHQVLPHVVPSQCLPRTLSQAGAGAKRGLGLKDPPRQLHTPHGYQEFCRGRQHPTNCLIRQTPHLQKGVKSRPFVHKP